MFYGVFSLSSLESEVVRKIKVANFDAIALRYWGNNEQDFQTRVRIYLPI
jgi:hypothetical protein